jgi:hypothetical protein
MELTLRRLIPTTIIVFAFVFEYLLVNDELVIIILNILLTTYIIKNYGLTISEYIKDRTLSIASGIQAKNTEIANIHNFSLLNKVSKIIAFRWLSFYMDTFFNTISATTLKEHV